VTALVMALIGVAIAVLAAFVAGMAAVAYWIERGDAADRREYEAEEAQYNAEFIAFAQDWQAKQDAKQAAKPAVTTEAQS
jgi:hypothetical protein